MKKEQKKIFMKIVYNLKKYRRQFEELLSPVFCMQEIRKWRHDVYSLPLEESQRNFIWEYLNGDIEEKEVERVKERYETNYKRNDKNI